MCPCHVSRALHYWRIERARLHRSHNQTVLPFSFSPPPCCLFYHIVSHTVFPFSIARSRQSPFVVLDTIRCVISASFRENVKWLKRHDRSCPRCRVRLLTDNFESIFFPRLIEKRSAINRPARRFCIALKNVSNRISNVPNVPLRN